MLDTLRKCLRMQPANRRWWWLALPLAALVSGALEGAVAAAVFGLIQIINDPLRVSTLPVARRIAPYLPWQSPQALVVEFTALVAIFYVGKNLFVVGSQYLRQKISGESSAHLASTMLRGYLLAPYPFHFRRNSAELIRNTTDSIGAVFLTLDSAIAILTEVLVGAAIVCVLLFTSPYATLGTAAILLLLIAVLLSLTRQLAERSGREGHDLARATLQTLQHALGGIKEIKTLGREEYFYSEFSRQQRLRLDLGYLGVTVGAIPQLVIETAFVGGALLAIALVTVSGSAGPDGLPLLGLFAYAGFRLVPMANRLTWRLNELRGRRAAVSDLYDDHVLVTHSGEQDTESGGAITFNQRLELVQVSYIYPGSDTPALRDVSLTICRGESLGIVGPSGAGKSTLVDIIVGLLPPTSGRITIDGAEIHTHSRAWRQHVGYVPQSIYLIDDTLQRNIAFGIPDSEVRVERISECVRMAKLDSVVASLPHGLDSMVGERGMRLSGGERQRIAIARALYHNPDVIVFDEATSALDNVTEAEVSLAIDALTRHKTILIIAHRLSTVRRCDQIAFMSDGTLVARGSFEDLAHQFEDFRRLALVEDSEANLERKPPTLTRNAG